MDNILLSGCSYTHGYDWPEHLWPRARVTNLARSGASNLYISDSIIDSIDLQNKPDYVFVLWSGLNKLDMILPVSAVTDKLSAGHEFYGKIGQSYYFFDGGNKHTHLVKNYNQIKDPAWPQISNLADFFMLDQRIINECHAARVMPISGFDLSDLDHYLYAAFALYRLYTDTQFFNDRSLRAIANCVTFLEHHQIPYQFSFCCDVFAKHADSQLLQGRIDKTNKNFSRITWNKYVKLTPYEFGLRHDFLSADEFHLTHQGMNNWADQIRQLLLTEKNHDKTI